MSKQIQRGFTLIELIVVIVILGILAAFAVPRFMGLENEARVSAVSSMMGTLRSTAAMAHGMCMAQSCTTTIAMPGGNNIGMAFGYPNQTIGNGIESLQGFTASTVNTTSRRFLKTGARDVSATGCWVQYNSATGINAPPTYEYAEGVLGTGTGKKTEAQMLTYLRSVC